VLAAAILGFPYSWMMSALTGSWNFLDLPDTAVVLMALAHFVLWGLLTVVLLCILRTLSAKASNPTRPRTPSGGALT
jgi:hypothetical protein